MTKSNIKILQALETAAGGRAQKLMEDHRDICDDQVHHDYMLRAVVMDDLAKVCADAIKAIQH